jgi:hypothetical protein
MKPLSIKINKRFDMNYIKTLLKALAGSLKSTLMKEVDGLGQYQPMLKDLIAKNTDPEIISKKVVEFVQQKLKEAINKVL